MTIATCTKGRLGHRVGDFLDADYFPPSLCWEVPRLSWLYALSQLQWQYSKVRELFPVSVAQIDPRYWQQI
jgi:hypothetical protein